MINQDNCLFLCIDIQEKLLKAVYNPEIILNKAKILLKSADILDIPTIITEQYPKGLGSTVSELKLNCVNAKYFEKTFFSAIKENSIFDEIKKYETKEIVIFGIESHICVYQTVIDLKNNNYNVTFVLDASSSRIEKEHIETINNLRQNGINVKTVEMILFELLKTSKHPKFKEIQSLIK